MTFVFWSADCQKFFRGQIYIGPTSYTHCTCCNKKAPNRLEKGIAVTFKDEHGIDRFVSGPSCFTKHTDLKKNEIPVVGWSFDDIETKRKVRIGKRAGRTSKKCGSGIDPVQQDAYVNVLLRGSLLPALGFEIRRDYWEKLLKFKFPYSARDLEVIQRAIDREVIVYRKPDRIQLECAYAVFHQIEKLERFALSSRSQKFVRGCKSYLFKKCGLTDAQMKGLEQIAMTCGVVFSELDIRFPVNEARLQASRQHNHKLQVGLSEQFNRAQPRGARPKPAYLSIKN